MKLSKCNICKTKYVPEVLLLTIEPLPGVSSYGFFLTVYKISITGKGSFLEARVCREKRKAQGEANAVVVSQAIPFLEYDIHR